MNESIVAQAKQLILQALALLGGANPLFTADNDPMTAALDQRGVWNPGWLQEINAQVLARFPGLIMHGPNIGADGKPTTATPIKLINGLIFAPISKRTDLTPQQRSIYQKAHNDTFLAATTGDFGNTLAYLPLDDQHAVPGPGYYVAALHSIHQDPEEVRAKLVRLYRYCGLLPEA